ncbi:MAG: hypothetical protein WCI34_06300 [Actinomycetes bacterium]
MGIFACFSIPYSRTTELDADGSVKDEEFIATVGEFPTLPWIANTSDPALPGLTSVVG